MYRRVPHPFFNRQPVGAGKKNNKKEQPSGEIKAEAAVPDFQAEALFPQARLAQAYVIWQRYGPTFSPAEALEKGTIFPDLYSPYPY